MLNWCFNKGVELVKKARDLREKIQYGTEQIDEEKINLIISKVNYFHKKCEKLNTKQVRTLLQKILSRNIQSP